MQYISFKLGWCVYQAQPGNETEGMRAGNQNPAGNQAPSGQTFHGPISVSHVQIPVAAGSIPLPSLNAVGTRPLFWHSNFSCGNLIHSSCYLTFFSFSISANS